MLLTGLLMVSPETEAQQGTKREPVNRNGQRADFVNERYGPHPDNTFDLWLAESDTPAPLVIFIHGGGFIRGDKSTYYRSKNLVRFLESGVSAATINYRFMTDAPYGIKACLYDARRCLQYIRCNAGKYNIDKTRIACVGGSAGAGTSLWLAFSEEAADPGNEDPVLHESTRISCAGAVGTQCTYDIFRWEEIFGLPVARTPGQLSSIAEAFGVKSGQSRRYYLRQKKIRKELDFLAKIDPSDPPVFVRNARKGGIPEETDAKWRGLVHHPLHAKAIRDKAEKEGVKTVVYAPGIGISHPSGKDLHAFIIGILTAK